MAIGTGYCKQASLWMVKRHSGDHSEYSSGATSSTTYHTAMTLSFTPEETSDYLILSTGCLYKTALTGTSDVRLIDDNTSTTYGEALITADTTTARRPWHTFTVLTNLSGSQSFSIQIKSSAAASGTAVLNEGKILALRLNTFPRYAFAESLSTDSTTSTTPQDKTTLAFTSPQNQPHLLLSSSLVRSSSISDSIIGVVARDGEWVSNTSNEKFSPTGDFMLGSAYKVQPSTPTDITFKTQYASRLGASMSIRESKILALQIRDDATVWIKGGQILGGVIK